MMMLMKRMPLPSADLSGKRSENEATANFPHRRHRSLRQYLAQKAADQNSVAADARRINLETPSSYLLPLLPLLFRPQRLLQ